jgi:hypothetical protein
MYFPGEPILAGNLPTCTPLKNRETCIPCTFHGSIISIQLQRFDFAYDIQDRAVAYFFLKAYSSAQVFQVGNLAGNNLQILEKSFRALFDPKRDGAFLIRSVLQVVDHQYGIL